MTRKLKLVAAVAALVLPLTAYGIASAQQDATARQPPQGHMTGLQGQMMGPGMQGDMMNMQGDMMKMMGQMAEMAETCNAMMQAALQKNGQDGRAGTGTHQEG